MRTTLSRSLILAAALTGLTVACSSMKDRGTQASNDDIMGQCYGINACKGQTMCMTSRNGCDGANACKGQGWIALTAKTCKEKGGSFIAGAPKM